MQPVGPYRFTHLLGGSPIGKAWAAVDAQGRFLTVAVLDAAVANDARWRQAFATTANGLGQTPGGQPYEYADFSVAEPWVAYPSEAGPGAEKLFRALGVDYQPVPAGPDTPAPVSAPPQPVSAPPQPVSGVPHPTSGAPHAPWALHVGPIPTQPVSSAPHPVSGAPQSPAAESVAPYDPFAPPERRIRPSEPPRRRSGLWAGVAALVLVAALGGGAAVWAISQDGPTGPETGPTAGSTAFPTAAQVNPGLKPWAQAAPYSAEERALAVAAPSLVFVEAVFTGVVRDARTNAPVRATPITFTRRCSAFLVTPNGHALTSSSCVKPAEENARQIALDAVARMLVREKKLIPGEVPNYVRTNLPKTRFTGIDPGSEPTSEVYGQLNNAQGNLTTDPAIPAQVVRAQPAETGNTALIKLARENLPTVQISPSATLAEGASLLVLGFSTSDTDFRTATYSPQSKLVTITGTARRGAVSIWRINEDIGVSSHGGIALDPNGRVAGMVDQDQARPDRANRVVLPAATVNGLLTEAGVGNTLGDTDKLYRSGLDAYFAGEHTTAISRFEAVAQNSPANLLAQAYRQNAIERQQNEGAEEATASVWPMVLIAAVGGALLVGSVVLVLLRRRRPS
ncbi:trypsin-like peptidase domain-containing protein [Micromonospora phytophila]|uniref:trypsin-like peptidase domain-containing protein n=1 Tax=Micromonospora phytophila TaxID=709888 RepID=UPI00202F1AB5|nr:trypsin-like peptidase domain-containing protein [Micromonospora phytophila]MCM0675205.1 trypsin-like peptidase domain-containing protein [Micromonospora phytophila]